MKHETFYYLNPDTKGIESTTFKGTLHYLKRNYPKGTTIKLITDIDKLPSHSSEVIFEFPDRAMRIIERKFIYKMESISQTWEELGLEKKPEVPVVKIRKIRR